MNTQPQAAVSPTPPERPKTGTSPVLIFAIIVALVSLAAAGYFGYLYSTVQNSQTIPFPSPAPVTRPTEATSETPMSGTSVTPTTAAGWKSTTFGGLFSYEYPEGWHVAELWPQNNAQIGDTIVMDPNPISTAPRGGPRGTFEISVINGRPNPDQLLTQRMNEFNDQNYTDITKETLDAPIGTVYHYTGKMAGEMFAGQPVENYYLTFNKNPNDPANQQVVIASMSLKDDPQLSAMLRHIVMSIRQTTP